MRAPVRVALVTALVFAAARCLAEPEPPVSTPADSVPSDFPAFQNPVFDTPSPGKIFLSAIARGTVRYSYLTILNENLTPLYFQRRQDSMSDFKMHPNGRLTFFDNAAHCIYVMNADYAVIDSFRCVGYGTDGHDFLMLKNGHVLLMSYESRVVDVSVLVPGGNPAATVTGLVIQELDSGKQPVFEWKSWDHFAITDATHEDLTAASIDYVHANAFDVDADGNILLSSRHMDEITKISRATGAIIWRLGGKHNQFTFVNDTLGFSHQHDIRQLANGHITMFDNGNFHVPSFSRAVEYSLDENAHTAELVWQYRNTPDIYGLATGDVQRLPNGNTLISWGTTNIISEVRPDGTKAMELILSPLFTTYRAFRFPWSTTAVADAAPVAQAPELFPAYPNPFNPATTIRYALPEGAYVTLSVFNILGQRIAILQDGAQGAGHHEVGFDATNLPSGVYLYRIQAGDFSQTRKLIHVK
jgi:hypothetical protein